MSFHNLGYSSSYAPVSQQASTNPIFVSAQGSSMNFYIPYDEPERETFIKYITDNGGNVTDTKPTDNNGVIILSSTGKDIKNAYRIDYLWDSIKEGIPMDLQNYKIGTFEQLGYQNLMQQHETNQQLQHFQTTSDKHGKQINNNSGSNSKHSFLPEEDEYILEQVRLDPRRRTSHKLFDEIAMTLTSHTGNSIRYRYRNQLERKLGYVYKTDPQGKLVKDVNGNYLKESIDNLPKTLKNRFTAQDDYALCVKIIEYNHQEYQKLVEDGLVNPVQEPLNLDRQLTVPVSFFREMEKQYPNHTRAAWRDRYRKFASKYGIKKYVDYYVNSKDPQPMKDFTKRSGKLLKAEVDQVKSLIGDSYNQSARSVASNDKNEQALDEEIGEIKSSNIDDALLRTTAHQKPSQEDEEGEELFVDAEEGNSQAFNKKSPTQEKMSEKSQLIQQLSQPTSKLESSQEQIGFSYPHPNLELNEIFSSNFYKVKSEMEALKLVRQIIEVEDESVSNLFAKFQDELGFTELFCTIIILYTNGDYSKIWVYLQQVLHKIYDKNLQLNESEAYKLLEIEGIDGIWNKRYDDMLRSGDQDSLLELKSVHNEESIELRKAFIGAT